MDTHPVTNLLERLAAMDFAHRLAAVRKQRGMTQHTLADSIRALIEGALLRHQAGPPARADQLTTPLCR